MVVLCSGGRWPVGVSVELLRMTSITFKCSYDALKLG